ncbi:MAG: hypothetical protein IKT46_01370 [Clostridia bacterium]|nr:hypothetical protein [Clostridia bacterium]
MTGKKITIPSEAAYILGIVFIAFGNTLLARADLGMSMVVAPAYLAHLKLSQIWSFVSFGMASYAVEGILLIVLTVIMRRFKLKYILSFCTAVIYGFVVDGFMAVIPTVSEELWAARIGLFIPGMLIVTLGVAFMFHTYLAPEAYDLFVKELCQRFGFNAGKCKTVYDLSSLAVSLILSFILFGGLESIGFGTLVCALLNGTFIGLYSHFMDKRCSFPCRLKFLKKIYK